MNKLIYLILILTSLRIYSQNDKNGNPIFNSVTLSEEKIDNYQLNSNYYTLDNNINNKNSSVFIDNKPTLEQIETAAIKLPSDFFLVIKDNAPVNMILIVDKPERVFFVINPSTGSQKLFDCNLKGEISENRAKEIVEKKFDKNAKIVNNKLFFNNKEFIIITSEDISKSIKKLITDEKLSEGTPSETKILDKGMLKSMIIKESKEGGKLDFFTEIKGHEVDGIQVKPGIFTTKQSIALYKWGRANFDLGVNTVEDALEIWTDLKTRKPNQREIDYIKMGFLKELEK